VVVERFGGAGGSGVGGGGGAGGSNETNPYPLSPCEICLDHMNLPSCRWRRPSLRSRCKRRQQELPDRLRLGPRGRYVGATTTGFASPGVRIVLFLHLINNKFLWSRWRSVSRRRAACHADMFWPIKVNPLYFVIFFHILQLGQRHFWHSILMTSNKAAVARSFLSYPHFIALTALLYSQRAIYVTI